MLVVVREYALESLETSGEAEAVRAERFHELRLQTAAIGHLQDVGAVAHVGLKQHGAIGRHGNVPARRTQLRDALLRAQDEVVHFAPHRDCEAGNRPSRVGVPVHSLHRRPIRSRRPSRRRQRAIADVDRCHQVSGGAAVEVVDVVDAHGQLEEREENARMVAIIAGDDADGAQPMRRHQRLKSLVVFQTRLDQPLRIGALWTAQSPPHLRNGIRLPHDRS